MPISKAIAKYKIKARDAYAYETPTSWTIRGSNNGTTWTILDTQSLVPAWVALEERTYTVANTVLYSYYRIEITQPSNSQNYGIGEWKLYEDK